MSSFPPIAIENNDEGLLRPLDPNNTTKHLPLRKRMAPILKWQPVETPEEHNRQYPHITPYPDLDDDHNNNNNNNKRTREEVVVNNNEQVMYRKEKKEIILIMFIDSQKSEKRKTTNKTFDKADCK